MVMGGSLLYNPIDPNQPDPFLPKTPPYLSMPPMQRPLISPVPVPATQSAMPPAPFLPLRAEPSHSMDWGRPSLGARYSHDSSVPPLDDPLLKPPSQDAAVFNSLLAKTSAGPSPAGVSERASFDGRKSLSTPPLADRGCLWRE